MYGVMKKLIWIIIGVLALLQTSTPGAEMRDWSSSDGNSKITASVVRVVGGTVVLKNDAGRQMTVPVTKLCKADQDYLAAYVKKQAAQRRAVAQAVDLPYAQGEVVGPINAGTRNNYLLYLPRSLTNARKAPLLFYTHSMGGSKALFKGITEGAEINGWIIAMSVESNNKNKDDNHELSKTAVKHILKTLPVDKDRVYFTGNSGGGALAYRNADGMDGCGVMPNVAYIPSGVSPPEGDCFILNGGFDYNRYASARARKIIGERAVHRLYPGGHGTAPRWIMVDGMVWLEGRYLARREKKNSDALLDYEYSVLEWIGRLKESEPHRAYYWTVFLRDELGVSAGNKAAVDALADELGQDPNNRLYVQGLEDIDRISLDYLSMPLSGSYHKHSDPSTVAACQELLEKYSGVPVVAKTLQSICKKTK